MRVSQKVTLILPSLDVCVPAHWKFWKYDISTPLMAILLELCRREEQHADRHPLQIEEAV